MIKRIKDKLRKLVNKIKFNFFIVKDRIKKRLDTPKIFDYLLSLSLFFLAAMCVIYVIANSRMG